MTLPVGAGGCSSCARLPALADRHPLPAALWGGLGHLGALPTRGRPQKGTLGCRCGRGARRGPAFPGQLGSDAPRGMGAGGDVTSALGLSPWSATPGRDVRLAMWQPAHCGQPRHHTPLDATYPRTAINSHTRGRHPGLRPEPAVGAPPKSDNHQTSTPSIATRRANAWRTHPWQAPVTPRRQASVLGRPLELRHEGTPPNHRTVL